MSTPGSMDLPDLNVWLALSYVDHVHHARAKRYWEQERGRRVALCSVTVTGLPRLLTSPPVMHGKPFPPETAARKCRDLLDHPDVGFLADSKSLFQNLYVWAHQGVITPKLWTDAWIAALALQHRCRVVSFDSDFTRFSGLDFLHLRP